MSGRSSGGGHRKTGSYRIIAILWVLVFVSGCQMLIIAPILPQISGQIAVSESLLGTLITAYAVSVGVFALITGPISDRIGRRRILLIGNTIMTVALVLHWFVWDFASLFGVRALAGVAGGILNGASLAYVGDYFPREQRGWANGWLFTGMAAGQIAGIPVGTLMAEQVGFRFPFLVFGLLLAVALLLLWMYVPDPDVELSDQLTIKSALEGYAVLLQRRDVVAAIAIFVIMFGGNALYITYLPTWLEATLDAGGETIATLFFFGGLGSILAGPRAGTLSDRVGRKRIIVAASACLAIVMLATTSLAVSMWVTYGLFFVVMGLFTARATPFQTLLTEMVASDKRGSFLNLTLGMGQIGSGLGGGLAGVAYASVGYGGTTLSAAAAMIIIGILVWVFLPETTQQTRDGSVVLTPERRTKSGEK
ncbi:MFS transporter [Halocatena marina]|uniref:MFS transporter n=1 Tax=Halocatena marina TaxID=2934937 RepID=UPI00200F5038|nr:MFS transporter [Halocatena marina]